MRKGIVVTEKNMMTIYSHLKKVVEKKKFLYGRVFYTRSIKEVNRIVSSHKDSWWFRDGDRCVASRLKFGTAGVSCNGLRICLNEPDDCGFFYIQVGNKVFISPNGVVLIERDGFQIKSPKRRFIVRVS